MAVPAPVIILAHEDVMGHAEHFHTLVPAKAGPGAERSTYSTVLLDSRLRRNERKKA
jgi:hypothetical protein